MRPSWRRCLRIEQCPCQAFHPIWSPIDFVLLSPSEPFSCDPYLSRQHAAPVAGATTSHDLSAIRLMSSWVTGGGDQEQDQAGGRAFKILATTYTELRGSCCGCHTSLLTSPSWLFRGPTFGPLSRRLSARSPFATPEKDVILKSR